MKINMKVTGPKELELELKKISDRVHSIAGEHNIDANELFNPEFMKECSSCNSFYEWVRASGLISKEEEINNESFKSIPSGMWEDWVKQSTKYSNWNSMQESALHRYVMNKLS